MENKNIINAELCHDTLLKKITPKYTYRENCNYFEWKAKVVEKFRELSGLNDVEENDSPDINVKVEWEEDKGDYRLIRFSFESEKDEIVPCYLCIPKSGKKKYPVAVVLQGHSTGFHNSIGEKIYPEDEEYQPRGAFALQAVKNGYIALAIEQKGLGERKPNKANRLPTTYCRYSAMVALGLGRTLLAERMWDVRKALDALTVFPECDLDKIFITGNSGGGTMSFYAACIDERIKFSVPSCSFAPYKESILSIAHCDCNYIPSAYKWFDMQDLACMIAPRPLIVITGEKDQIFPIEGVCRGFETVKKIYKENNAEDKCRLIKTPQGHWWCEDIVWGAINEECKKLGWID